MERRLHDVVVPPPDRTYVCCLLELVLECALAPSAPWSQSQTEGLDSEDFALRWAQDTVSYLVQYIPCIQYVIKTPGMAHRVVLTQMPTLSVAAMLYMIAVSPHRTTLYTNELQAACETLLADWRAHSVDPTGNSLHNAFQKCKAQCQPTADRTAGERAVPVESAGSP